MSQKALRFIIVVIITVSIVVFIYYYCYYVCISESTPFELRDAACHRFPLSGCLQKQEWFNDYLID